MSEGRFRERLAARLEQPRVEGRIVGAVGGLLRARLPDARLGGCFEVARTDAPPLVAELVAFDDDVASLLPFESAHGVRPGATVRATELGERAPDARAVLGRVVDPLGRTLDSPRERLPSDGGALRRAAPAALERRPIETPLPTGVRVFDGLLPMGIGQRVGLFAGSGVGKSTLLAQLARQAEADVVIVGLIGERGREVGEFLADALPAEMRERATVVVATSDAAPTMRVRAAWMATALAEQWRDEGRHVLLLVDSVTRYARALREVALAGGEPPARRGYPASVFAALPVLLERAGWSSSGAITAVYSVLVDGGDMEEPVADEIRGIVDGHWVLSRQLAERGQFPAVDVLASVSRVAGRVSEPEHLAAARDVREALALLERHRDAVDLGIYTPGQNPELDRALDAAPDLQHFLRQAPDDVASFSETLAELVDLASLCQ